MPEAKRIRPTRAFLQAVEKIQPLFAQTWANTIESTAVISLDEDITNKIPDGFKIAQIFRNQLNLGTTKAAFAAAATLQGEEAPPDDQNQNNHGQNSNRGQKCSESIGKHTVNQCYILNKHLRPKGWKLGAKRAKGMMKTFEQNKELQNKYKDAYREVESFLKELKKKNEKDSKQPNDKTTFGE